MHRDASVMLPHLCDSHSERDTATSAAEPDVEGILVRPLVSLEEYHACVALQVDIWGPGFSDIVPSSVLQVAAHVGALVVGAFAGDTLLGFVFGLTGVREGEIVHWSHMLGVRPSAREMGIGRKLKEYQRATLARRGVSREFWTFDPLQARNAHLNLNRLGVRVVEYVVDMYGSMGSALHFGVATDRLVVECSTSGAPGALDRAPLAAAHDRLPILSPVPRSGDPPLNGDRPPAALIEIPADVQSVVDRSADEMLRWRLATRASFQWAFRHGYRVAALHRDRAESRCFYVIVRDAHGADL